MSRASVTGVAGLLLTTALVAPIVVVLFATVARTGGLPMNDRRKTRLWAGAGCLALAAVVGLTGYLKLSLEPDVNRQIPYLASAGMAVVILAAIGAALLVGEQMRTDEGRIAELEEAVKLLADAVRRDIEDPPRRAGAVPAESPAPASAESGPAESPAESPEPARAGARRAVPARRRVTR